MHSEISRGKKRLATPFNKIIGHYTNNWQFYLNWDFDTLDKIVETPNLGIYSFLSLVFPAFNVGFISKNYLVIKATKVMTQKAPLQFKRRMT